MNSRASSSSSSPSALPRLILFQTHSFTGSSLSNDNSSVQRLSCFTVASISAALMSDEKRILAVERDAGVAFPEALEGGQPSGVVAVRVDDADVALNMQAVTRKERAGDYMSAPVDRRGGRKRKTHLALKFCEALRDSRKRCMRARAFSRSSARSLPPPPSMANKKSKTLRSASYWRDFHRQRALRAARAARGPIDPESLTLGAVPSTQAIVTFIPNRSAPVYSLRQNDGSLVRSYDPTSIQPNPPAQEDKRLPARREKPPPLSSLSTAAKRASARQGPQLSADDILLERLQPRGRGGSGDGAKSHASKAGGSKAASGGSSSNSGRRDSTPSPTAVFETLNTTFSETLNTAKNVAKARSPTVDKRSVMTPQAELGVFVLRDEIWPVRGHLRPESPSKGAN
ncbi:hypothetical protein C8R46DRAFT_1050812 [Mycena filopes]|nr:hypothetical protein C8R46DRAFT_1050812 [Mycena filopes]